MGAVFYCGFTYIVATMVYTGINIPYCALMGVITPNIQERTSVSQYRFFMAFAGQFLIATFMVPLVTLFGNKPESPTFNAELGYDPVTGYPTAMIAFGILATALFLLTFFTTKERVTPVVQKNARFRDDLKDLMGNGPWWVLFISAVLNLGNVAVRNGAMLYFLTYCMEGGSTAGPNEAVGFDEGRGASLGGWLRVPMARSSSEAGTTGVGLEQNEPGSGGKTESESRI
jgi:GPH family glycoside/pentoside/hexuronide:cation symporter